MCLLWACFIVKKGQPVEPVNVDMDDIGIRVSKQLQMQRIRELESEPEPIHRKQQNKLSKAKKRALETGHDTIKRKLCNAAGMAKKRKLSVSIKEAIATFNSKVKIVPQFVCAICHRMMYR